MIYGEEEHRENLRYHLRKNILGLLALREAGVREDEEVVLEFRFEALNGIALRRLADFLGRETGARVRIEETRAEYLLRGRTPPTRVSPEILETWVHWLCKAGEVCDCLFAGWLALSVRDRFVSRTATPTSVRAADRVRRASGSHRVPA